MGLFLRTLQIAMVKVLRKPLGSDSLSIYLFLRPLIINADYDGAALGTGPNLTAPLGREKKLLT